MHTGRTLTVNMREDESVATLKLNIASLEGAPVEAQELTFRGRTIGYSSSSFLGLSKPEHDERPLTFYNIPKDSEIGLILNPYVLAHQPMLDNNSASDMPSASTATGAAPSAAPLLALMGGPDEDDADEVPTGTNSGATTASSQSIDLGEYDADAVTAFQQASGDMQVVPQIYTDVIKRSPKKKRRFWGFFRSSGRRDVGQSASV